MGFFDKLKKINIFNLGSELTDDFYDELEESLILADAGMDTALEIVEELKSRVREEKIKTLEDARACMCRVVADQMNVGDSALDLSTKPSVVLFIGVNGVGKTTTIGKIGHQLKGERKRSCCAPRIPSGPPPPSSLPSGRTGPAWRLSSSTRGPTPPRWFLTRPAPPRPGTATWCWWTPPGGCTTSRT